MAFLGLLQSLDELFYELVSWLPFFPLTLWRSQVHLARMMNHGDDEPSSPDPRRYVDGFSPPLVLFLDQLSSETLRSPHQRRR